MKNSPALLFAAAMAPVLFCPAARGETAGNDHVVDMPEVVVTPTRGPRPRLNVPALVTVVDSETIAGSAAANADDLLRSVSGVSVTRSTGIGHGIPVQVNIRGVPGRQRTLLLLDGMPLNDALSGHLALNEVPIGSLGAIEIARGPFSALYGTDAFGGVISLITPEPGAAAPLEISTRAGNEGFTQFSARSGGQRDSIGYWIAGDVRGIDNYLARDSIRDDRWNPASGGYDEVTRPAENYDYSDVRLLGKAGVVTDSGEAGVHARFFESKLGYGTTVVTPLAAPSDSSVESRTFLIGANFSGREGAELQPYAEAYFRNQGRRTWGLDFSHEEAGSPVYVPGVSDTTSRDWRLHGGAVSRAVEHHTLSAGAEWAQTDCEFSALANAATGEALPLSAARDANTHGAAAYLQDEWEITPRVLVVAGVRLDGHSEFGETVSPRGGLVVRPDEAVTVRASIGRAFRAPSPLELFQPDIMFGSRVFRSNPELDPETVWATDAGIEWAPCDSVRVRADFFHNELDNLISTTVSDSMLMFANITEADSTGGELAMEWEPVSGCAVFANYTYQVSEDRDTGGDLPFVPGNMFNTGVRFSCGSGDWAFEGSVDQHFVGDRGFVDEESGRWREADSYWRTDASFRLVFEGSFWAGINFQNAWDAEYRESSVVNPAPGRLASLELGCRHW